MYALIFSVKGNYRQPLGVSDATKTPHSERYYLRRIWLNAISRLNEDVDETEAATSNAQSLFLQTIVPTQMMLSDMPKPFLALDEEGGLMALWCRDNRHLRLKLPAEGNCNFYLYFEEGDVYNIIPNPTPQNLSEKIKWLMR